MIQYMKHYCNDDKSLTSDNGRSHSRNFERNETHKPCSQSRQSIFGGIAKARFAICDKRVVFPMLSTGK